MRSCMRAFASITRSRKKMQVNLYICISVWENQLSMFILFVIPKYASTEIGLVLGHWWADRKGWPVGRVGLGRTCGIDDGRCLVHSVAWGCSPRQLDPAARRSKSTAWRAAWPRRLHQGQNQTATSSRLLQSRLPGPSVSERSSTARRRWRGRLQSHPNPTSSRPKRRRSNRSAGVRRPFIDRIRR